MLFSNDKISVRQLQVLLILDVFGTGVIILPRRVAEFANADGWLLIIFATLIALVYIYLITSLGEMFPNDSFADYTSRIVSRPVGILISILFVFKIFLSAALELRIFTEIIKQIILFNTPSQVISAGMLFVSAAAAFKGYETRARLAEILIFIAFIPLIIVFCTAAADVDPSNLKPFLTTSPSNILQGSILASFAFSGIELCLLVFPYVNRHENVKKGAALSVLVIGALMLVITVLTTMRFGLSIVNHKWPVLEMMDAVSLPGSFIERQNALIISFWIISVFAILNACLFFSSILIRDILKRENSFVYIFICAIIIYGLSLIPESEAAAYEMIDMMNTTFGIAYLFFIPVILFIIAKLRGLGR